MPLPMSYHQQVALKFTKEMVYVTRMQGIEDNNSLLHAFCNAFCITYIMGKLEGVDIDRVQFIKKMREQLGTRLSTQDALPPMYAKFADTFGDKSLYGIKEYLLSQNILRLEMLPYIASQNNNYDVFVVNSVTGDLETGSSIYFEYLNGTLESNRNAIILLYNPNNEMFSTACTQDLNNNFWSVFTPYHFLVTELKNRIKSFSQ